MLAGALRPTTNGLRPAGLIQIVAGKNSLTPHFLASAAVATTSSNTIYNDGFFILTVHHFELIRATSTLGSLLKLTDPSVNPDRLVGLTFGGGMHRSSLPWFSSCVDVAILAVAIGPISSVSPKSFHHPVGLD